MKSGLFLSLLILGGSIPLSILGGSQSDLSNMPDWPILFRENFDSRTLQSWEMTDADAWKIVSDNGNKVLSLFQASEYVPPVRSPSNIALMHNVCVADFVLEAKIKSTSREYGHRDMVFIFGWQDPSHFYYAHIASKADQHANSIFLVDGTPRVSIANMRTNGTQWVNERYHTVRILRKSGDGTIEVYFDDMTHPIMSAVDTTFLKGYIGFGSFDDTGNVDDIQIWSPDQECSADPSPVFD